MSNEKRPHGKGAGKEHPKTHIILLSSVLIFFITWIFDFILFYTTIHQMLFSFSPQIMIFFIWPIRITLFILTSVLGICFMRLAEKSVFDENDSKSLKKEGIYARVRNPMYLGIPTIFLAFTFLSMSLISLLPIVITFILYTEIVKHEEDDLEKIFGEEYRLYKEKVPRWFPRLTRATYRSN